MSATRPTVVYIPSRCRRKVAAVAARRAFVAAVVAAVVALCASAVPSPALAQSPSSIDAADLATFVDSLMAAEMAREKTPGAGFVFVQNGRVLLQRGYGLANVVRKHRVSPDSTIWRVGSISKVFTATTVMQLVERGEVDLDAPVDRYVRRVSIPKTFAEPITVRQLLDHTGGLDEIRPGTQAPTREEVLPLAEFLETRLARVRPPGRTIAYSTYGITLAGEMIEEVTGDSFERVLARMIWEPLGMTRSSITVRPELADDVAMGYEINGDSLQPQAWEWYHTTPASSVNATVADMARFLIAHLERGAAARKGFLSDRAKDEMQRQQVTMHPSMPGYCLGFGEDFVGGLRVVEHGGNMAGFSAQLVMIPEANAGFFLVNHAEGSQIRDTLKWALLQRYFLRARERRPVPTPPPAEQVHAERFAGRYAPLPSCWSCDPVRVSSLLTVAARDDGTLDFAGGRWIAVDSLRFVRENGSGYIVFTADSMGAIGELFAGAFWGWKKLHD